MTELIEIMKLFGPTVAAIAFFIWRDAKRESRMANRMDQTEDYVRQTLTGMLAETTKAVSDQAESNRELCAALDRRPCLAQERLHPGRIPA